MDRQLLEGSVPSRSLEVHGCKDRRKNRDHEHEQPERERQCEACRGAVGDRRPSWATISDACRGRGGGGEEEKCEGEAAG